MRQGWYLHLCSGTWMMLSLGGNAAARCVSSTGLAGEQLLSFTHGGRKEEERKRGREREGDAFFHSLRRAQQLSSLSPGWCGYWRVSGIVTGAKQHKPELQVRLFATWSIAAPAEDAFALKSLRDARRRVRFSYLFHALSVVHAAHCLVPSEPQVCAAGQLNMNSSVD